ncbi:MAG TPA: zf-HC2 domain-containing protein [Pyrinomonadaceae bacterium]|jgi:hypothetical protein
MKCEDLQFNLSLYTDDVLTPDERNALDGHLATCPLCRQKLADFQALKNSLRAFSRPEIPAQTLNSARAAIAAETSPFATRSRSLFSDGYREWLQMRVMPYGVGALASLILGFTLLYSLLSAANRFEPRAELPRNGSFSDSGILLANAKPNSERNETDLTPTQYAQTRMAIAGESPSINPQGALIALTKSLVRGDMKDEEVVVVADVFGDGLAQIAEVVEPSRNRLAVIELEKALKNNSEYAPFVPANLDGRSDTVRVVLKIQSVNVKTHLDPKNN